VNRLDKQRCVREHTSRQRSARCEHWSGAII